VDAIFTFTLTSGVKTHSYPCFLREVTLIVL